MAVAKKKTGAKKALKKTVKKAAPKKAAAKKAPAKKPQAYVKISTKILGEAPQEYEFYLTDGRKLKSVYELVDALESMTEDVFQSHVNEMKNDFSSWIKDVFNEPDVASEIAMLKDRIETQKTLIRRLIDAARSTTE